MTERRVPARRERSARRPEGGRWPVASGHRPDVETVPHDLGNGLGHLKRWSLALGQRPKRCLKTSTISGAGPRKRIAFPRPCGCEPQDRISHDRKARARPAGAKHPPMVGRALAGGFGPPAQTRQTGPHDLGDGLGHCGGRGNREARLPPPLPERATPADGFRPPAQTRQTGPHDLGDGLGQMTPHHPSGAMDAPPHPG